MKLYSQLLEVFTIREIKSSYKASLLGILWIILYPLMTTFFLSFLFERIIKITNDDVPYFVFLLSGLIFWNFFQQGVIMAKDSLVWNREVVTKTTFSKEVLPLSLIFSKIPDFFVNLIMLFIFLAIFGFKIKIIFISILLSIIPVLLFAGGIGFVFAITNAIFRDFGKLIEFFLMIFFYATPILYSESIIPKKYLWLAMINPLALIISFVRNLLFHDSIRIDLFIISLAISFIIFLVGIFFFRKFEKKIVDLI